MKGVIMIDTAEQARKIAMIEKNIKKLRARNLKSADGLARFLERELAKLRPN